MEYKVRVIQVGQDYSIPIHINNIIHTEELHEKGLLRIWYVERIAYE